MTTARYLQRPVPLIYLRFAAFWALVQIVGHRRPLAALLVIGILSTVAAAVIVAFLVLVAGVGMVYLHLHLH